MESDASTIFAHFLKGTKSISDTYSLYLKYSFPNKWVIHFLIKNQECKLTLRGSVGRLPVRQVGKFWALNATALTCESLYRTKSRGKSPPKYRGVASEPKLVGTESSHAPIPLVAVG
ncbi:hypothetical protein A9K55_001319 [Cordyceps militaris]|uniref:Uncharacterized protein n=1 Tax=Cordyceps militaris TaxID=73501 RepID=A0A2H4SS89_CORMI|nr:hypothetical protein A9K55_001319 [Cordyceps militaris]